MARVVAVLLLAPVLAAAIALASREVVPPVVSPKYKAKSVVWSDRVFSERQELTRWLRARGIRYETWAERHPGGVKILRRAAALERRERPRRSPAG